MENSNFDQKFEILQKQVDQLKRFASRDATQSEELPLEILNELLNALEELQVAEEELRQQNDELAAAYQMLESERRRYRNLFEFAPDGYLETNASGIIQEANHAVASLLHMRQEFILGRPLNIFITKEDRETINTQLYRFAHKKLERVQDWEVYLQPHKGVPFPSIITVAAVRDPQGDLIGLRWLIRDITERKQTEEEFRKVQERFSGIYNSSKDAIGYASLEGILIDVNDSFLKLTGYSREELINRKTYQDITPQQYYQYESEMIEKLLRTGEAVEYEKEFIRKDGSRVPILLTAFVIKGADCKPIGIAAIIKDITEHRHIAEALRKAHDKLETRVRERTEELAKANEALQSEIAERRRVEEALREKLGQLSKKNRYETIISTVTRSVHQSINLQDVLENAVEAMNQNIDGADNVSIYLVEGEEAVLRAYRGYPDQFIERIGRIPYPKDYTWKTIIEGKPVYCVDVDKDMVVGRVGREIGIESYVSMPVRLRDKTIGAININSLKKNAFDQEELNLLEIVAHQIEVAINNAHQAGVLRESEERFRSLADTAPAMIWMSGPDKLRTYFNKGWLEFTGRTMKEEWGYGWAEGVHPDDLQYCLDTYVTAFDARRDFKMEYRLERFDGEYRWVLGYGTPRFLPDGSFTGYIGSCIDIADRKQTEDVLQRAKDELEIRVEERTTELRDANERLQIELGERRRTEEVLRDSEERYRALYEDNPSMYFTVDSEGRILSVNKFGTQQLGYNAEELVGQSVLNIFYEEDKKPVLEQLTVCLQNPGQAFHWEFRKVRKDGSILWVREVARAAWDTKGNMVVLLVCEDITERRWAGEQLKASLKEKEMLLKEIHHRVKNNLQVISSLLDLQSQYIKHRKTLNMFNESQNRVKSMALIHEVLYQSKDLSRVNFAEYIRTLGDYLFQSYGANSNGIKLKINVHGVLLGVNTAIICGLIINELVSNSLKYAFPKGGRGEIRINLQLDKKKYTLIVSDNGVGFPKGLNFRNTKSLGLQLVMALTHQLGGAIRLDRNRGTEFKIRFTELKYTERK